LCKNIGEGVLEVITFSSKRYGRIFFSKKALLLKKKLKNFTEQEETQRWVAKTAVKRTQIIECPTPTWREMEMPFPMGPLNGGSLMGEGEGSWHVHKD